MKSTSPAPVGNVVEVEAGRAFGQFHVQVLAGAVAGARIVQRAGLLLRRGEQLVEGGDAGFRRRHEHVLDLCDLRHADDVAQRVVGQLLQVRRRYDRRRVDGDRVAVGCAFRQLVGADGAARPGAVVDHDRLPPLLLQLARHQPADEIERPAGRKGNDEPHRLGGELGRCDLEGRDPQKNAEANHAALRRPG
jgi:hypothetical protein